MLNEVETKHHNFNKLDSESNLKTVLQNVVHKEDILSSGVADCIKQSRVLRK